MERVVLLDESGQVTGVADKQGVHHSRTPLHLAFSCYLFDPSGRLLLTRRASSKKTWPGVWTNSCCGHPEPGEAIHDSVVRRVRDELGMSIERLDLVLPTFRYRAEMHGVVENEMCPVFRASTTSGPVPDADEVAATEWVAWGTFRERATERPSSLSPWCVQQLRQLDALADAPADWPVARHAELPPAARHRNNP